MTITARIHNRSITLPEDVSIAEGTLVEIHTLEEAPTQQRPGTWMLKFAGVADDLPADAAAQHDHYLYGTPKR